MLYGGIYFGSIVHVIPMDFASGNNKLSLFDETAVLGYCPQTFTEQASG